ncbi:MAG: PHP domain-containing protein [Planctomycetota bacterium]
MPSRDIFQYDYHIHTVYSGHSAEDMRVSRIIQKAGSLGLKRIVILEHVPGVQSSLQGEILAGEHDPGATVRVHLDAILEERAIQAGRSPVEVLVGAEVDADPKRMDGSLLLGDLSGLDLVIGSTHYLPDGRGLWYDRTDWLPVEQESIYREWFLWAGRVVENPRVEILAHPGVVLARHGGVAAFEGAVLDDFAGLFAVCRRCRTAIELNELMRGKLKARQVETYENVLALARDMGLCFSIGSDAHRIESIGRYEWVRAMAGRLGLTEDHLHHPKPRSRTVEAQA